MTTRELSQLYHLRREIQQDQERLAKLEMEATACAVNLSGMPHAPGVSDKVGRYAADIADLRLLVEANLRRCGKELIRLNGYIDDIPDSHTRQIFRLRYIDGCTWGQVAARIGGGNTADGMRKACTRYLRRH